MRAAFFSLIIILASAVSAEMRPGLSGERCLGRFGWNQSGSKELRDGLLFNGVDENGMEACVGLGDTKSRMWRLDVETPGADDGGGVKVKWLNWIAKEVEVRKRDRNYNLIYSLAFPGVVFDGGGSRMALNLRTDTVRYAAWQGRDKVVVRDISSLKDGIRGGDLAAGWLLFFGGRGADQRDVPMLLTLSKPPKHVRVTAKTITLGDEAGRVVVCLPFGLRTFEGGETEKWAGGLPETVARKCHFWARAALEYPVGCAEYYDLDEENRAVRIEDRYEYSSFSDAWGTEPLRVAPLPPMVSFAMTEEWFKDRIRVFGKVEDLDYPTWYGELAGNVGGDRVAYSLPVPYSRRMIPLRTPANSPLAKFMSQGAANYKWSERRIQKYALDPGRGAGLDLAMSLLLSPEVRKRQVDAARELLEGFLPTLAKDTIFYKEPSSGKGFWTHRKSISPEKDNGSFRIDRMRAYDMSAWPNGFAAPVFDYAIWSGDRRMLNENWEALKKLCDSWWVVNDWAFMSAFSTDEAGCNANNAVDCIWDSLAGMESVWQMAELVGDKSYAGEVQYLWARQLPVSMLHLATQWNYLPKYLHTFTDSQFTIGSGELDTRYTPRIPFLLSDCKWLAPKELMGLAGWVFPLFLNHASMIWPSGPLILLCETAPKTTSRYLGRMDEMHPEFYLGKGRRTHGATDDGDTSHTMFYNHLFMSTLLEGKDAFREKTNGFYPEVFQRQFSVTFDEDLYPRGFFDKPGASQFPAAMAWLGSPVYLGNWGGYKILDGSFTSGKALVTATATDDSDFRIRFVCAAKPESVSIDSSALSQAATIRQWREAQSGWFYQPEEKALMVKAERRAKLSLELLFDGWRDCGESFTEAPAAGNLLNNPGLEERELLSVDVLAGDAAEGSAEIVFNRWQACVPSAYYDGSVSVSGGRARSGKSAAKLLLGETSGFKQDVSGTPGRTYQAEFYFNARDLSPDKESLRFSLLAMRRDKIRMIVGETSFVASAPTGGEEWRRVPLTLTCPADAGIIRTQVTYQPLKGGGGADRIKTVFIDDMSLRASDSPSAAKPAAPPAKRKTNDPGLIFHASFDKGLDADFAKGDGRAGVQSGLECVVPDGIHGSCLRLSENGSVSYYTGGNFNAGEGALSVWINPARSQPLEKIKSLKWWAGSYFWTEFNFTDYNRFSFGMDLPKNDSGIFNTFFQTENGGVSASGERPAFRHSAVESVAGEWHHVAATWKKGGGEEGKDRRVFYFDGAPRNAVSDAALPPVVRGVMTLGCFDPSRQYYGLLDELRIYNRALTAQEIKKLSKER